MAKKSRIRASKAKQGTLPGTPPKLISPTPPGEWITVSGKKRAIVERTGTGEGNAYLTFIVPVHQDAVRLASYVQHSLAVREMSGANKHSTRMLKIVIAEGRKDHVEAVVTVKGPLALTRFAGRAIQVLEEQKDLPGMKPEAKAS